MEYLFSLISIVVLLVLIVGCCVFFTNAVEHLGKCYKLGHGAVGCVLAAIGTALPETIVPLVAIFGAYISGSSPQVGNEIGIGAILGSPFLLSTLAMFVTGLAVLAFTKFSGRDAKIDLDSASLKRDLRYFLSAYTIAVLTVFVKIDFVRHIIGLALLIFYLIYIFRTIKKCSNVTCEDDLDDLFLAKVCRQNDCGNLFLIWSQIVVSILCLICFSYFFVENIKFLSSALQISPLIVSLLLAPVATELPEMFNSVIWVKQSKDTLALSNITGAIVFQSCIPMTIGILFTTWTFTPEALVNIALVYIAVIGLYLSVIRAKNELTAKTLLLCGGFYFIYIAYVLTKLFH